MSEAKFTPGPWKVFTAPNGTMLIGIGEATGEGVFDCGFGVWRSDEEKLANAHLAAAAPALYECARILASLDEGAKRGRRFPTEEECATARSALLLANT